MNYSFIALLLYFGVLLFAVMKEKKNENVLDYFFAGRTLPFWALSITFIASWWGAGSAISTADLAYDDGIGAFWYYGVPVLISTFLMILFSKWIRNIGFLTQGEMMKERYDTRTAKSLAVLIFLFMTFSAATQMVGVGDFFGQYMGLDYEVAVLLGTSIVVIYSWFGGFRGVVLTDIIQFVLLLISAVLVFGVAWSVSGGIDNIAQVATQTGKTDFLDVSAGAVKYLPYVITFGCSWMIQANVWQRISATKNKKDAKKMAVMSFIAYIPLYLIVVLTGMAAIVLYDTIPDGGVISAIVVDHMTPFVGAIVFVGISAAIMSTMDSLINTAAMTLSIDLGSKDVSESKKLAYSKKATLLVTGIALVISLLIRDILEISWIASDIITTGAFVPLVAGFLWKRGNRYGAFYSIVTGAVYSFYNLLISNFGFDFLPRFWESGSALQVILGVILSLIVYVGVSLCTPAENEKAMAFMNKAKG